MARGEGAAGDGLLSRVLRSMRRPGTPESPTLVRASSTRSSVASAVSASAASAAATIPDDAELEEMFERVVLDTVGPERMASLSRLSRDAKWQMVLASGAAARSDAPGTFVERLRPRREYAPTPFAQALGTPQARPAATPFADAALVKALRIQLSSQPLSWVRDFVDLGGADTLAGCLRDIAAAEAIARRAPEGLAAAAPGILAALSEWLRVLRAFTNSTVGLEHTAGSERMLAAVCGLVGVAPEPEVRMVPVHVLTVVCYAEPGASALRVLNALAASRGRAGRFDAFLRALLADCAALRAAPDARTPLAAVVDGLVFVNALLENVDDDEVRAHVRSEVCRPDVRAALADLSRLSIPALDRQLSFLASTAAQGAHSESESIAPDASLSDVAALFAEDDGAELRALLVQLLAVRATEGVRAPYIRMLARVLAQVRLAGRGLDPDWTVSPVPLLSAEQVAAALSGRNHAAPAPGLEAEAAALRAQLAALRAEKDLDRSAALKAELDNLRAELESARSASAEAAIASVRQQLAEAQARIAVLQGLLADREAAFRRLSSTSDAEQWPDLDASRKASLRGEEGGGLLLAQDALGESVVADGGARTAIADMPKHNASATTAATASIPASPIAFSDKSAKEEGAQHTEITISTPAIPPPPPMPVRRSNGPTASVNQSLNVSSDALTQHMANTAETPEKEVPGHPGPAKAAVAPPPPPPLPAKVRSGAASDAAPADAKSAARGPPPPPPPMPVRHRQTDSAGHAASLSDPTAGDRAIVQQTIASDDAASKQEDKADATSQPGNAAIPPPPPMPRKTLKTTNDADLAPSHAAIPPPPPMPKTAPKTSADADAALSHAAAPPPPPMPQGNRCAPPPPGAHARMPSALQLAQSTPDAGVAYPRPSVRLRPMQWKKLYAREVPGTLWENMELREYDGRVPFAEIDRLFAAAAPANAHSAATSNTSHEADEKQGVSSLLAAVLTVDDRMLLSIVLSKVPHDEDAIARALADMDDAVLAPRLCAQLRKCLDDERIPAQTLAALAALNGCVDGISDRAERLVVKLAAVPAFPLRLRMLGAKADFADASAVCARLAEPFFAAFRAVRASSRLRAVLGLVLYVGNYVNQESSRGNAPGFRVEYLTAIKPLRSAAEPGTTMLTFIVGTLARSFPDVLGGVGQDLAAVAAARPLRMADVEDKAAELARHVDAASSLLERGRALLPADAAFFSASQAILADMDAKRGAACAMLEALRAERTAALAYFGEAANGLTAEALLSVLAEFAADIDAARAQVAAMAAEGAGPRSPRARRTSVAAAISERGEHRGVVDNVLASLRAGSAL